jgi:hypothetical protein
MNILNKKQYDLLTFLIVCVQVKRGFYKGTTNSVPQIIHIGPPPGAAAAAQVLLYIKSFTLIRIF